MGKDDHFRALGLRGWWRYYRRLDFAMKLSSSEKELLREVLAKREPAFVSLVDQDSDPSLDDLSIIIDRIVGAELAKTGFATDWEPNSRGLALEDLINKLNRIRWRLQRPSGSA